MGIFERYFSLWITICIITFELFEVLVMLPLVYNLNRTQHGFGEANV